MSSRNTVGKGRYGSFELKDLVGPNLIRGFVAAVMLHGVVAASPMIFELLKGKRAPVVDEPPVVITLELPPLKSFTQDVREQITLSVPRPEKPVITIPIPSETEVAEDSILPPSTDDLRKYYAPDTGNDEDGDIGGFISDSMIEAFLGVDPIPSIDSFIAVEVLPQELEGNPPPQYPEMALVSKMPGTVYVKVFVDQWGDVKQWKIMHCSPLGLGFEEEVEKVIPKWKFTPAIQGGNAVGVWVMVPFKFKVK
ncbi:MAG: energy transducer TonB [Calditrichota bacterium]